ncbi:PREDICTED: uncharacterized protein LOC109591545 [Amphimedon queenslandica]|uniref:NIDO domain-containing protein n=1 Tax=Amphimedon queenslandica TaxID=400682 RepID=A0A1X7STH0_AMPQE|nr:PREDICTED: uncharacterized protein LOC109591545 [Amphimedon queenslandica]|eukprot:XP_019862823.1 PREDICTED: uncharacterized protein LOC109591545 [Amphimedon queenslandica]
MGSLTQVILVILSTCYTNGLSLNDLYPYGTEHGDTMSTRYIGLSEKSIQPPIDNFVRFGQAGFTLQYYSVRSRGSIDFRHEFTAYIRLHLLKTRGAYSYNKIYGRTTADSGLIKRAMDQINEGFPNTFCSTSPPTQLIIATWIDYEKDDSNPGSNFQAIIVTNGSITFGIALYVDVHVTSADETGLSSNINSNSVPADPSFFPFGTTVTKAPTMMLNSNIPGTYIFSLNDIPPDTCSSACFSCKSRLFELVCEIRRINGEDVPTSCNN